MTRLGLATLIRLRTRTDTTTFPDSEMLVYVNTWLYEIAKKINEANEDYFGIVATANLVASQREYSFPLDVLNAITSVEVKFSASGDWIPLGEFDVASFKRPTDETSITNIFDNEEGYAAYDIYGNSLTIYSGTISDSVTAGLKLHYFVEPDPLPDLTDNTVDISEAPDATSYGFPKQFHELLARRVVIEHKENAQQPIPLNNLEQKYDFDLELAIDNIKGRNLSRSVIARVPMINGFRHSNVPFPLQSADVTNDMYGYNS